MKAYNILGTVICIILAFVSFFATSNIFIGGGVLIISEAFYFLLLFKPLQKHKQLISRIHECYLFINNFLVTLSIKESLNASFEAMNTAISDEYREYIQSIDDLNPQEKLLYLKKYFPFHIYQLFVEIVFLWLDEGGKILDMSSHIINEMREIEEYTTYSKTINRRKGIEIITLWLFSLSIVIALRLALTDFYSSLLNQPIFIVSIILLMLLVLLSFYLMVNKVTKIEIRGIKDGQ